jgi:hypothetical protein
MWRWQHGVGFERVLRPFVFATHAADRLPEGLQVVVVVDRLKRAVAARLGQVLEDCARLGERLQGVAKAQIRNALRFYRLQIAQRPGYTHVGLRGSL